MYSQRDEETHILAYFTRPDGGFRVGRFLDVGAADGLTFSNTRALADRGWRGVLIDGSAQHVEAARRNYAGRENIVCEQAVVCPADGDITWHQSDDLVSSVDPAHVAKWRTDGHVTFRPMTVHAISPQTLLARHPGPYDMVNLDVEGISWPVLLAFPVATVGAAMWVVEYDSHAAPMIQHMRGQGYRVLHQSAENLVFGR